jgi:3-hydroxyisobutyrate dehydrogenase
VNVGLIGLGRMGSAMAERLAQDGFEVTAWDQNVAAVRAYEERGGRSAPHPRAVASAAPFVITTITEDAGVRGLFAGDDGILRGDIADTLFIEMSTLQPVTVRELAPAIEARGARIVDSPVLGSIPSVRDGTLVALLGGADADIARARTVLDSLASKIVPMGPLGCGHAMKLVANLGLAAHVQALAESLALGEREGLPLDTLLDILSAGVTGTPWLKARRGTLIGEPADVTLDIRTLRKDVMSIVAVGSRDGVPMPLSSGVLSALSAAVVADWGDRDIGAMAVFLREAMVQRY